MSFPFDRKAEKRKFSHMKATITMGRRGAITIPAGLRRRYALEQDDLLMIEATSEGLLLRPAVSMPVEIYSEERIAEFSSEDGDVAEVLKRLGSPGATE